VSVVAGAAVVLEAVTGTVVSTPPVRYPASSCFPKWSVSFSSWRPKMINNRRFAAAAIAAPARAVRARSLKVSSSSSPTPLILYQVLAVNMRRVAATARRAVSMLLARWTLRENKKTATKNHTKKWKKRMNLQEIYKIRNKKESPQDKTYQALSLFNLPIKREEAVATHRCKVANSSQTRRDR